MSEDIRIPIEQIVQPEADPEEGEELSITPLPAPALCGTIQL